MIGILLAPPTRMAGALRGLRSVGWIDVPERPGLFLFAIDRGPRGPLTVVWERGDPMIGEDAIRT